MLSGGTVRIAAIAAPRLRMPSVVRGRAVMPRFAAPARRAASALIRYGHRRAVSGAIGRSGVAEGPDREGIALDRALMARIAAGSEAAFAALAGEETPRLLRFARSLLAESPAEAEEIVQEALLRLWRQAAAWKPEGRVSTWLHQVAYRLAIDAVRRRRPSVTIESVETELEDEAPVPDARLMQIDDVNAVRAAVARLPERQRTALLLCHFQDMGQGEAALVMGIGERAYESLLARARRRLKALLGDGRTTEEDGASHGR